MERPAGQTDLSISSSILYQFDTYHQPDFGEQKNITFCLEFCIRASGPHGFPMEGCGERLLFILFICF